ncbi:hypothetical protein [Actinomyces faecalis]|uniref:hypothetical protein n=1 Tax=Actinomyces faecalis TaxID=2722820 RepID=UPI001556D171|nr:hypothetical protein [Actinomyces faecalis]
MVMRDHAATPWQPERAPGTGQPPGTVLSTDLAGCPVAGIPLHLGRPEAGESTWPIDLGARR